MDWMYLFWFLLGSLLFFGARFAGRGQWNEDCTSLEQTRILKGISALGVAFHHMAQKTCAPWHPRTVTVHGLDAFLNLGYPLVGIFLFCSGLGLYKSMKAKPDYLHRGFFRRRILPVVIAFYLSEFIYLALRLAMGEKMDLKTGLWYLSGLHLANFNAWFAVIIPFFYLVFWAAFRFCRHEGTAILSIFVFTLGYTVLGAFIDHQNDWWMRGEWWYNSILLFPLGILFGRFEKPVIRFFRRGYAFWLIAFLAGFLLLFWQSEWLFGHGLGYYGYGRMKVPHRLMSAGIQWAVALLYVGFWFLLGMKVRLGNGALAWLGTASLDFYLMHGMFVELFGYSFLDEAKSLVYIRNLPLYILAVLASSTAAAMLFRRLRLWVTERMNGAGRKGSGEGAAEKAERKRRRQERRRKVLRICRKGALPMLAAGVCLVFLFGFRETGRRTVGGITVIPPEGYEKRYSDGRYVTWEYAGKDMNPGRLTLDEGILGAHAQRFQNAEAVLRDCDWMTEEELYINPQGIRMARGFANEGAYPERRYYVECDGGVFLLSMIENSQYYSTADCEKVMLAMADSLHR